MSREIVMFIGDVSSAPVCGKWFESAQARELGR
jgi:hypothetical protein